MTLHPLNAYYLEYNRVPVEICTGAPLWAPH